MVTTADLVDIRDVKIDRRRVYRRIGYEAGHEPPARIASLMDDYIENVHHIVAPHFAYEIRDIEWVQGYTIFVEGSIILESKVIARMLEKCEKVAMFVLTIGDHLEETIRNLNEDGLVLHSAVLDAIGSNAAEMMADTIQKEIKGVVGRDGLIISPRFSPGYCDWNIQQQQMIFQAIDGDPLGVKLTDTCLMIPQKSISGVIGIGTPESNIDKYNPCKTCRNGDCTSRRTNLIA